MEPSLFKSFTTKSPTAEIYTLAEHYPSINEQSLQTELQVIYTNESFHSPLSDSCLKLFQYIHAIDTVEDFPEVSKVLEILLATPVHTAEPERKFSTLARIKSCSRNCMSQDRLNALAVLSVHKEVLLKDPCFNKKVIDKFASQKDRRSELIYREA